MGVIGKRGVLGDFGVEDGELHKKCQSEGTSLRQTASFEPSTIKIGLAVWSVRVSKKLLNQKKSHRNVIFHACAQKLPLKIGSWYSTYLLNSRT